LDEGKNGGAGGVCKSFSNELSTAGGMMEKTEGHIKKPEDEQKDITRKLK